MTTDCNIYLLKACGGNEELQSSRQRTQKYFCMFFFLYEYLCISLTGTEVVEEVFHKADLSIGQVMLLRPLFHMFTGWVPFSSIQKMCVSRKTLKNKGYNNVTCCSIVPHEHTEIINSHADFSAVEHQTAFEGEQYLNIKCKARWSNQWSCKMV